MRLLSAVWLLIGTLCFWAQWSGVDINRAAGTNMWLVLGATLYGLGGGTFAGVLWPPAARTMRVVDERHAYGRALVFWAVFFALYLAGFAWHSAPAFGLAGAWYGYVAGARPTMVEREQRAMEQRFVERFLMPR